MDNINGKKKEKGKEKERNIPREQKEYFSLLSFFPLGNLRHAMVELKRHLEYWREKIPRKSRQCWGWREREGREGRKWGNTLCLQVLRKKNIENNPGLNLLSRRCGENDMKSTLLLLPDAFWIPALIVYGLCWCVLGVCWFVLMCRSVRSSVMVCSKSKMFARPPSFEFSKGRV